MVASKNEWKDKVWLAWFALQVLVILLVDAIPFYPKSIYEPPGSPLHFMARIRANYIAQYNDPIVQWTPERNGGHDTWIPLFAYIEMFFQLPTAVYAISRLSGWLGRRGEGATTGADELLFLVYALETSLTTLVCLHDVFWWDDKVYSAETKSAFLFKIYGPWFLMPTLMFADMYIRLLRRFSLDSKIQTTRKTQ